MHCDQSVSQMSLLDVSLDCGVLMSSTSYSGLQKARDHFSTQAAGVICIEQFYPT